MYKELYDIHLPKVIIGEFGAVFFGRRRET